jgi:hypothetical protein
MKNFIDLIFLNTKAIIQSVFYTNKNQTAKVSYKGNSHIIEIIEPYGVESHLPVNNLVLSHKIFNNNNDICGMGYSCDLKFGDLKEGEVCFGLKKSNNRIVFRNSGEIEIVNDSGNIVITNDGNINIKNNSGFINVKNNGNIELNGNSEQMVLGTTLLTKLNLIIQLLNNHVHTSTTPGLPTTAPTTTIPPLDNTILSVKNSLI